MDNILSNLPRDDGLKQSTSSSAPPTRSSVQKLCESGFHNFSCKWCRLVALEPSRRLLRRKLWWTWLTKFSENGSWTITTILFVNSVMLWPFSDVCKVCLSKLIRRQIILCALIKFYFSWSPKIDQSNQSRCVFETKCKNCIGQGDGIKLQGWNNQESNK